MRNAVHIRQIRPCLERPEACVFCRKMMYSIRLKLFYFRLCRSKSTAIASHRCLRISSVPPHLTLPNSNGSRTRWRVSSLVNTDGLEHPNLLLLFIGCQSSGELISRFLQFFTNSSRPVNLPTWPTKYLNMFLVAHWGQAVRVHCPSLAQKQSLVRALSGLPLRPSGIDFRLTLGIVINIPQQT